MKKVLFLQVKGNSAAGVWFVNKQVGEALLDRGYAVENLSIRKGADTAISHDRRMHVSIINEKDPWEIVHKSDILSVIKQGNIFKALKVTIRYLTDHTKLKRDYFKVKKYIKQKDFDYIITSHYQLLDAIPKRYLKRTINEHHSSFDNLLTQKDNLKKFKKYNKKINFLWLCKSSYDKAVEYGYENNHYIYNPIKFVTEKKADVANNKKLITISRLSSKQKRIDLMVDIANEVLPKYKDWVLELYGDPIIDDNLLKKINQNKQIRLMGFVDDPKEKLLNASIYLSTSEFEGFSLSILEAYECGLPVISYNFGESCEEQVIDNKTGYVIDFNCKEKFIEKLETLMNDFAKLEMMSKNAKKNAKYFHIENIIDEWIELFNFIEKGD